MSLVNQMLKDLEQRRAHLPAGDSLRGLHAAPVPTAATRRWPLLMLTIALAGGGFGIWYARSTITLPEPWVQAPLAAAPTPTADTPATAKADAAIVPTSAPAAPEAPAPIARNDQDNAAEYTRAVDSRWDREWLADMNEAVSVASLEEHLGNEAPLATDEPPVTPAPSKAKNPDKPAPRPAGTATTALAAAGSMHKTPRSVDAPTAAARHYATAVTLLRDGDRAGAEAALRDAIEARPGDAAATQALAALLLQQGRRGEAEAVLAEALARQPAHAALAVLRARLLAEGGRDREAAALLERVKDAEAQALLGALQQRLGNDAAAAAAYQRALTHAPREGAWWLGLAISLERSQQTAAALEAYRRALTDTRLNAQVNDYVRTRIAALGDGRG